jgi:hypothetical protein
LKFMKNKEIRNSDIREQATLVLIWKNG